MVFRVRFSQNKTVGYLDTGAMSEPPQKPLNIDEAFVDAVSIAEIMGARFLVVDDPDGLYPPDQRPVTTKAKQN